MTAEIAIAISAPIYVSVNGSGFWNTEAVPSIATKMKTQLASLLSPNPIDHQRLMRTGAYQRLSYDCYPYENSSDGACLPRNMGAPQGETCLADGIGTSSGGGGSGGGGSGPAPAADLRAGTRDA